ncbi:beta-ketoacyl-ACP synthase II [Candidatus Xianfuyuplasma coldseepsis]|uniref:3-oxoacyl-[acyl-carrier-protein] synthase 2 n=1 Tax=Candidatus Xianfuyuplasma coldseepsis TaxID=2782163 RepID=A0A7L7KUI5_9MOLU|nr:beta-ketoacyl-ACP synthase II [Xianfuyuplasma coldseepsis]QMS85438.1 beta-ketoacyl-ACP synthase II [Xianfuyuplasma coldseepsis]
MKRRVVVTGMGAITPLGNDWRTTWENAKQGTNGIDFITGFDISTNDIKIGGEIKNFDFDAVLGRKFTKRMDKFVQLAMVSTKEAVADSELDFEQENRDRCGVYFASGIGGLATIASEEDKAQNRGYDRISPFFIPGSIINIAAGQIAIDYGLHGMATSSVTACASATNGIGDAFRAIRDGYLDIIVAGGSEASMIPLGLGGFNVMQALNRSNDPSYASIPFDKNREGFVMGEGSATLILEEYEHAIARGAHIYAEIVGYGSTCDAYHITGPDPEADGARKCMELAISDAGLDMEDVDYINAHGTSTPLNDRTETKAIKKAFGDHAYQLHVSSTKSMTGHLLGASGAVEAIFTAMATKDDFVPPTINSKEIDKEECDLNYTLGYGITKEVDVAISNSLGFGGHNATIVFKKYRG